MKKRFLLFFFIGMLLFFVYYLVIITVNFAQRQNTRASSPPPLTKRLPLTFSDATLMEGWKKYTGEWYSFEIPKNWQLQKYETNVSHDGKNEYVFTFLRALFVEDAIEYTFTVYKTSHEIKGAHQTRTRLQTVNDITFLVTTYYKNNKPFAKTAVIHDEEVAKKYAGVFSALEMGIPFTNTGNYTNLFDKILMTFRFTK